MQLKALGVLVVGGGMLVQTVASAALFTITDRVGFNSAMDTAADAIESQVNDGFLANANRQTFLDGMGKAVTSGTASISADRGARPRLVFASIGAQVGFQGELDKLNSADANSLPPLGVGGQAAVIVGIPGTILAPKKFERLSFYLSGGSLNLSTNNVSFKMFNLGLTGAYQVIPEFGPGLLARWGGVRFLTGLTYASGSVGYGGRVTQSDSSGMSVDMNIDLRVENKNFSIPLEVSTSLQLLYIFNIYAGGGVDFNFGSAKFAGVSSGPVTTGVPGTSATAVLDLDDGSFGATTKAVGRAFAGAELNFWAMRIGAEFMMLGNSSKAASLHVRVGL